MIQDLFEIVVAYYQYLASILQTKGVKYTPPWLQTGESMSIVSLDEAFFSAYIPSLTRDARIFFILVSIIVPLLLVFLGLLTFNEPSVVVWYFILLASFFTLVAGVCAAIISQTIGLNISFAVAQVLMIAGAVGLLLCSVAYLCARINRDEGAEELEGAVNEDALEARRELEALETEIRERPPKPLRAKTAAKGRRASNSRSGTNAPRPGTAAGEFAVEDDEPNATEEELRKLETLRRRAKSVVNLKQKDVFRLQTARIDKLGFAQGMLFSIIMIGLGVILIIGESTLGFDAGGSSLGAFALVLGVVLLVIGVLVLAWILPSLSLGGRQAKWRISKLLQENGMRLLILLIMILYIPIGSSSVVIFNCNTYECPDGFRLIDEGTHVLYNYTTRSGDDTGDNPYCYRCVPATEQRASPAVVAKACDYNSDVRLESAPPVRCSTMQQFFWPAAGLAILYILGVPIMYFRLISHSTAVLKDDFPVDPGLDDWEQIWETKVVTSENVAKFLYQPFEYKFRFWRLGQLLQKLGVVITGTYVFNTPWDDVSSSTISLGCALLIHTTMSILLFITEPFIRLYDDGVATTLSACLVSCCVVALLVLYGIVAPDVVYIILISIYLAVPLILFTIGVHLELRWAREAEEAAEEEQRRRVVEHLEKMDAGQMRAAVDARAARLRALREGGDGSDAAGGEDTSKNPLEEPVTVVPDDDVAAPAEDEAAAARPMTALKADAEGDAAAATGGYKGMRGAGSKLLAVNAMKGRKAGHAAPSFLLGKDELPPPPPTTGRAKRSGSSSAPRTPGSAGTAEDTSLDGDGVTSPRINSKRFSMRKKSSSTDGGGGDTAMTMNATMSASTVAPLAVSGEDQIASPSEASPSAAGPSPLSRSGIASPSFRKKPRAKVGRTREEENPFETSGPLASHGSMVLAGSMTASSSVVLGTKKSGTRGGKRRDSDRDNGDGEDGLGSFVASPSRHDMVLRQDLEHSSGSDDGDDVDIEKDEEQDAKLEEKRAQIMARVLRAEAARKKRRDLIESGKLTEEEAEVARSTRLAAMIKQNGDPSLTMSASAAGIDIDALVGDEDAVLAASLDGAAVQSMDDAVELELAEQALEVIEEQMLEETREMREKQGDVDLAVNTSSKRTVNRFLMAGGFIGFAALGCSLLGMLATSTDAVVSVDRPRDAKHQLNTRLTWDFFTDSCVCVPVVNDAARLGDADQGTLTTLALEVWVCDEGSRIERVRSRREGNATADGYAIRPLCGMHFNLGCAVTVSREEDVALLCPPNNTQLTSRQLALW